MTEATGAWVRELTGEGTHEPASHARLVARAREALGASPFAWAVDLGHVMALDIGQQLPDFGVGSDDFETLRMGTEASALCAMMHVVSDTDETAVVPDESLVGGRDFARRGIPLNVMLRGIRLGHAHASTALLEAGADLLEPEQQGAELTRTARRLFEFIAVFSTQMTAEYLTEHDRWVSSAAAERLEIVRNLLSEGAVSTNDASKKLGYPLHLHHRAMVVWQESGSAAPVDLQRLVRQMLATVRAEAILVVPHGALSVWVWAAWPSPKGPKPALDMTTPGVHVVIGGTGSGPAGFRRSHREAQQTAELVRSTAQPGETHAVTWHADVELAVLLSTDLALARGYVTRELGELAAGSPNARDLRETVAAYLAHDRSLAQAAGVLHVARNTIAYRVKKAEAALGHDLRSRRLEVECALRLAETFGSRVLADA